MENSLLIAGFGGQGIMTIGQILGYSAASQGLMATYFPSYGAEQRGGTANCTVVLSEDEIGSPVREEIDYLIAMNEPSLKRFEQNIKPGGVLLVNSSLIGSMPERKDITVYSIAANEIAENIGSNKIANLVMLGAFVGILGQLNISIVKETILHKLGVKKEFVEINDLAFEAGLKEVGN